MSKDRTKDAISSLPPRLKQILQHASDGKTDKEIANLLCISVDTVETHWKRLRTHFGASTRTQVVSMAWRMQIDEIENENHRLALEIAQRKEAELVLYRERDQLQEMIQVRTKELFNTVMELMREQRRRAEELSVAQSLREAVEQTGIVMLTGECDPPYSLVNATDSISQFGYTADDVKSGKLKLVSLVHPEDWPELSKAIKYWAEKPLPSVEYEFRLRRADGTYRWVLQKSLPRRVPNCFSAVQLDITERKNRELMLQDELHHLKVQLDDLRRVCDETRDEVRP